MSPIQWTSFHNTPLGNGGWPEHILFFHSSLKSILYFTTISMFPFYYSYSTPIPSFITLCSSFHSKLYFIIWLSGHCIFISSYTRSYCNFDILLFSVIFHFTLHSISFLPPCNIMVFFHCQSRRIVPSRTPYHLHIIFRSSIIPFIFSAPCSLQVHTPLLASLFHCSHSPFHPFLHPISNPLSAAYYFTLQIPFILYLSCAPAPLAIPSSR